MIICRSCESAVIPQQVKTHLASKHRQAVSSKQRVLIYEAVLRLPNLATRQQDVRFPQATDRPVPHLPVELGGFGCSVQSDSHACGFVAGVLKHMQQHCRDSHGWANPNAKKRRPLVNAHSSTTVPWRGCVSCQQFFKTGGWQCLFEVRTPTTPEPSNDNERLEERLGEHRDRILRTTQTTAEAAREAQRRVCKDAGELETDSWQRRAGFGKRFVGFNSEWLAQQTRLPVGCNDGGNDSDGGNGGSGCEGELLEALTTISRVVWHAKRSCTVDVAGLPALILVISRDCNGKSAERQLSSTLRAIKSG